MKYIQNGEEKNISFETADFSTMIEKSNPLYTYGVIFCKKTQEISVSYKAPKWYQLLARTPSNFFVNSKNQQAAQKGRHFFKNINTQLFQVALAEKANYFQREFFLFV